MLIQQRDRYKQQCTALNQRVQDLVSSEADIRRQLTQLQEDNHGLFAKLKYAQSFSEGRARHGEAAGDVALQIHASSTSYDAAPSHSRGGGGKYQDFYEERLDPFSRFRQREKTRRIAQMHPIEKVMYGAANLMLRSRHMRMAVVVYVGLLHCLVFATLYRVGWNSHDLVSESKYHVSVR
ncbi:hypothetical protein CAUPRSCDRAFT_8218 [Caulochytrium protostelioides]|nr:hypothetical protein CAUPRSCDRAFT_8218 [Caulochytrium protostelioides]